jgi:23S rRNA U2552 (ribose-2'-O)-methylase RlmE/FtsJ
MNFEIHINNKSKNIKLNKDIFNELSKKLGDIKKLIDEYPHMWDKVKKNIHDYEYVYTSSFYKKNIAKKIPYSRSYFKMKEMIHDFNIKLLNNNICTIAEAPGGFIQCLLEEFIDNNIIINGVTLISKDKKVPFWNKKLLNHKNIKFHKGIYNNGDLYSLNNVLSMIKNIGKESCYLVTGDGGFDNSNDYNNQEYNSLKLIYSEIFLTLNIQSKGGIFICKFFDLFLKETIILIYILFLSYDNIYFHKPQMSRYSNSEKYIVCKGFKGYNKEIINKMIHNFDDNKIDMNVNKSFFEKIIEYNNLYTNKQIEYILKGIEIIEGNNIMNGPTKTQINKSLLWCKKYNVEINNDCFYL